MQDLKRQHEEDTLNLNITVKLSINLVTILEIFSALMVHMWLQKNI